MRTSFLNKSKGFPNVCRSSILDYRLTIEETSKTMFLVPSIPSLAIVCNHDNLGAYSR